jgi:hypothetical protein
MPGPRKKISLQIDMRYDKIIFNTAKRWDDCKFIGAIRLEWKRRV